MGILLALFFVSTFAFAQLESTFSLFIEHRFTLEKPTLGAIAGGVQSSETARAAARATGGALAILGTVSALIQGGLIGRLTRRFGEKKLTRAGLLFLALGLGLFPAAPSYALILPVCVVIAIGMALLSPSLAALLSRSAGEDEQGGALGLGQSLSSLARVLGPILGGLLFERVGLGAPYWTGATIMLLSLVLSAGLRTAPDTVATAASGDPQT
jgi:DHA1 family tetracycline resistance protein-like MFS transporter